MFYGRRAGLCVGVCFKKDKEFDGGLDGIPGSWFAALQARGGWEDKEKKCVRDLFVYVSL